jgi:FMN-dependent oxidoreductase (nitrilotriacetate monooxygenase family)
MSRKMHLGVIGGGAGSHIAGWRMPDAEFGSQNLALLQNIADIAERGKFDLIFFADAVNTGADAHPSMILRLEPLTLLAALAMSTKRIGLVATVSTTYSEPYNDARAFASIDHMSGGRAGWNVVTGSSPDAAANFSRDKHPPHEERYAIAEEYVAIAKGLWDSWEEDAIVGDKARGVFADAAKMHVLDHKGKYFSVKGPLNITRPPQGYPVIFQAGASDRGLDFAGATAEVVFATQQIPEEAKVFADKLREGVEAHGRPRDAVRIIFGVSPVIGGTEQEAQEKVAKLASMLDPVVAMRVLSDRLGTDMSQFPLDGPVPELPPSTMMQGHAVVLQSLARRKKMTLRQLRDYAAVSSGHRLVVGTAAQIADDLEAWFSSGIADGFVLLNPYIPGPLEQFVDEVVPLLVRRNLFRSEYEGRTLRENLGLAKPPHPSRAQFHSKNAP